MAKKKKIKVGDLEIRVEKVNKEDYISLTDIAKKNSDRAPNSVLISWIRNQSTISFLGAWENTFNPNFKHSQMATFRELAADNRGLLTPKNFVEQTGAIGMTSKSGRYGGTYAHKDIALNFCYWLSPEFQVAMIKTFQELLQREFNRKNLEWHISKITDNIEEARNLLDTIPFQDPDRNRIGDIEED